MLSNEPTERAEQSKITTQVLMDVFKALPTTEEAICKLRRSQDTSKNVRPIPYINTNWCPDKVAVVDIETQSIVDLREVGSYRYLLDPTTRLLSAVVRADGITHVWIVCHDTAIERITAPLTSADLVPENWPVDPSTIRIQRSECVPDDINALIANGYTFVGHNSMGFDAIGWAMLAKKTEVPSWYDTMFTARAGGLPGGIENLGRVLCGRGKSEGKTSMHLLCKVKSGKLPIKYPVATVHVWRQLLQYNIVDVLITEHAYNETLPYGEPDVMEANVRINQRGIYINAEYANALRNMYLHTEKLNEKELSLRVGDDIGNIRSSQQVVNWLEAQGYDMAKPRADGKPTLNKQALEQFFTNPDLYEIENESQSDESEMLVDPDEKQKKLQLIFEVLRLRQQIVRTGRSKIERIQAMLTENVNSRVYDQLSYWGAHTGRWSGRGLQPHNFARGVSSNPRTKEVIDIEALTNLETFTWETVQDQARRMDKTPADILSTLTRSAVQAKPGYTLVIADYGQVEARKIAWLAREQKTLDLWGDVHKDPYKEMASRVFNIPIDQVTKDQRQLGKILELAAGYGMGGPKFNATCYIGHNLNLKAAGIDPDECIRAYRRAHHAISGGINGPRTRTGLWQRYHDAAHEVIHTRTEVEVGRCLFFMHGKHFCIQLPSGRVLVYRHARIADRVPGYFRTLGLEPRAIPTIVYAHPHGREGSLYGGLIAENIDQASCRDLLALTLVNAEERFMYPVLHVHDEVVCEVPDDRAEDVLNELCLMMTTPPAWAQGLPILVEGMTCRVYSKTPFKDSVKLDMLNGVKVIK